MGPENEKTEGEIECANCLGVVQRRPKLEPLCCLACEWQISRQALYCS